MNSYLELCQDPRCLKMSLNQNCKITHWYSCIFHRESYLSKHSAYVHVDQTWFGWQTWFDSQEKINLNPTYYERRTQNNWVPKSDSITGKSYINRRKIIFEKEVNNLKRHVRLRSFWLKVNCLTHLNRAYLN